MPAIPGYAHLAKDPGNRSGTARIASFGVRVAIIVQMYQSGMKPEHIVQHFDDMPLGAVFSALAYAADHATEIDAEITEDEVAEERLKEQFPLPEKIRAAFEPGAILS